MQRTAAGQNLPYTAFDSRRKLAAVVPAYNESQSIAELIAELRALNVPGCALDLIVVDDGSGDQTAERAREAGARVISLPFNLGIGLAVQTGFRFALGHGADIVLQVDGDGQHIPGEITKLLAPIFQGKADVVIGTRFARGRKRALASTTPARWLAGRALAYVIRLLTGQPFTDTTSGFRAFSRAAADLVAMNYPDDYPEVQALVTLVRSGFRVVEVPVRMRSRLHGRSSINWWRAGYYLVKVIFSSFMDKVRK